MEQRDYLKDQIDRMTAALVEALTRILHIKQGASAASEINAFKRDLIASIDIDINEILALDSPLLHKYFERKNFGAGQLELMALIMEALDEKSESHLKKALILLELADAKAEAQSMRRVEAKNRIRKVLSEIQGHER